MALNFGSLTSSYTTAKEFYELTASDVTTYAPEVGLRAIIAITTGNANLVDHNGHTTLMPVTAGQYLPIGPYQFLSTSSTARLLGLFR